MSEVKRYDPMGYDKMSGYMDETPYGDYVRGEDYDQLKAENAELKANLCESLADSMMDVVELKAENERRSGLVKHYSALNFQLINEKAELRKQLDEAHRLLRAYGGGVHDIDTWLEETK